MRINPHHRAFCFALWCLLLFWTFFGALVLAEEFNVITETAAPDQPEQDLDKEALSLLASGLKLTLQGAPPPSPFSAIVSESVLSAFIASEFTPLQLHHPPSRPLYQRLSVYRI